MLPRLEALLIEFQARPKASAQWRSNAYEWDWPENLDALLWLHAQGNERDRAELAECVAEQVRSEEPRSWVAHAANQRLWNLERADLAAFESYAPEVAVEWLGLATLSANGFVREAALRALGRLAHPRSVAYVLLRLVDWVVQVRSAAAAALDALLERGVAAELIAHHGLVERLERVERVDFSAVAARLRAHLREPRSRAALEAGLASERAATRLYCWRAIEAELDGDRALLERALGDCDPLVRDWVAARVLITSAADDAQLIRALLRDRASRVRACVLRALPRERADVWRDDLCELALSDAANVRELARFVLRHANPPDFAALCRARLDSASGGALRPGWIATLGELGAASDFERVANWIEHPSARIRAAALAAAVRLDRTRAEPAVVRALQDPRRAVRTVVWRCLRDVPRERWAARAEALLRGSDAKVQRSALVALTATRDWQAVPALLEGLLAAHASTRSLAWQGIDAWQRRNQTRGWLRPSYDVKRRMATLWPSAREQREAPHALAESWSGFRRKLDEELGVPRT